MKDKIVRKIMLIIFLGAIIAIPGLFWINGYLAHSRTEIYEFFFGVIYTAVLTISICLVNIWTFFAVRKRYNQYKGYLKGMLIEILITTLNAIIITIIVITIAYLIYGKTPKDEGKSIAFIYFSNILISVIVNSIAMGFVEAYTLFVRWKTAAIESERLLREKADARFSALKNQVNPHFLFNSLNSLSSLIRTSPEKAIEFVDKFSKIYRYVLDSSDLMLIELREEINFINSFIFLQKIRFGENLQVQVTIDSKFMNYYIAPLSLQLLLENAIKHNEISSEFPFFIQVEIDNNYLVVKNQIRLKSTLERSTGIGLKNLEERYEHFTDRKTSFKMENGYFIAKLPLLNENEI